MLLVVLAYMGSRWAARRLDRRRFARRYEVAARASRRDRWWRAFGRDFWRGVR